ncbi:MAG: glutamate-cysteine ligase family protein, partial [Candidatus Aminicenantes bacterium]|nr:glutamate-cysteine ligase family protein [Candidatus Aminicenantes bacterium]
MTLRVGNRRIDDLPTSQPAGDSARRNHSSSGTGKIHAEFERNLLEDPDVPGLSSGRQGHEMNAVSKDLEITLGIEEEFFLVDPETRDLVADPDPAIYDACERNRGPHKVVTEFLRSQIETNTRVCASVAEVREALVETRRLVIEAASQHGAAVLAASTHPFASWTAQMPTPKKRYERFEVTFQEAVRRLLIGGM